MSNKKPIFTITNLECAYNQGRTVLNLPELIIPSGKLVFVLGVSGIGKSTLIETLGLMNNTIKKNGKVSISFHKPDGSSEELCNIWDKDNVYLSEFRQKYFSFIFQDTNLMSTFTAGENMAVTMLLDGKSMSEAKSQILEVMDKLNLAPELFDRPINALSGGQRQRLAFVRAFISNFSVLFGDEPTGNLDKDTSHKLMNTLKSNLRDMGRSGLIVSHDIPLAMNFADSIILLSRSINDDGEAYGSVDLANYMVRQNDDTWQNFLGDVISDPFQLINETLLK